MYLLSQFYLVPGSFHNSEFTKNQCELLNPEVYRRHVVFNFEFLIRNLIALLNLFSMGVDDVVVTVNRALSADCKPNGKAALRFG